MSRSFCEDCGCAVYDNTCTNCHEELYIYETQYEYLPEELSEEFVEKVQKQADERKNKKYR